MRPKTARCSDIPCLLISNPIRRWPEDFLMLRRFLLVVTLTTSVHLLGQNGTNGSTNTAAPVPGTGYVNNGGYVTTAGNGQLVTPQAAYGTPAPTAGISNGDRAGITNNAPIQSSALVPSEPQVIGVIENAPTVPLGAAPPTYTANAHPNPPNSPPPPTHLPPSSSPNTPPPGTAQPHAPRPPAARAGPVLC